MPNWWCVILAFIEEIVRQIAVITASPGFTWGRSGNVNSGAYLLNDTVPSNLAGRTIPLQDGNLVKVFVTNQNSNTFDIEIVRRDPGPTFIVIATVSLVSQRKKVETFSGVTINEEDELAVRVSSGSGKNIIVGVIIVGSTA